jgi:homoserine kinase
MERALVGCSIEVPGSTSNLGPGFDALGLALDVWLRLEITAVGEAEEKPTFAWDFGDQPPPGDNAIERGFVALVGESRRAWPALSVRVECGIPMRAGLGSSAAAIVAGMRLFEIVAGTQPQARLLDTGARLEGHPDNTSPSILGGFVAACLADDGRVSAVARPWPDDLRVVVATPALALETRRARGALPAEVSLADAVANVQRTAVLVQAIAAGDRRSLREAFRDRLHQPYRLDLVPGLAQALAFEHPSLFGVFLSGAGPSIAAIADGDGRAATNLFDELYAALKIPVAVRTLRAVPPFPTP